MREVRHRETTEFEEEHWGASTEVRLVLLVQGAEVADADHGLVENAFEGGCGTGGGSGGGSGQRLVDVAPLWTFAAFPEVAKINES